SLQAPVLHFARAPPLARVACPPLLRLTELELELGRLQATGPRPGLVSGSSLNAGARRGCAPDSRCRIQAVPRSRDSCLSHTSGSGPPRQSATGPHFFLLDLEPASFQLAPAWGICPGLCQAPAV
ncbi:hypothetical protein NDU88_006437, partial [Pleurodeles waltl]